MSRSKFGRPSPALIIAIVALFVALGSGAYAATKIGTSDIQNRAVTKQKIAKKAASSGKLAKGAVKTNKINDEAVTNSKLAHAIYTAYVNTGGVLVRGEGATSVSTIGTGHRVVTFDTSVAGCFYLATGKYQEGTGRILNAEVAPGESTKVRVRIRRGDNGAATNGNSDFSLAVIC